MQSKVLKSCTDFNLLDILFQNPGKKVKIDTTDTKLTQNKILTQESNKVIIKLMPAFMKKLKKTPFFNKLFLTLLLCVVLLTVGITLLTYFLVIDLFKNELGASYIQRVKMAGTMLNAWEEETVRNALTITRVSNRLIDEIQQIEGGMISVLRDYRTVSRILAISTFLEETMAISNLYSSITLVYDNFNYLIKDNYAIKNDNAETMKKYLAYIENNIHWVTEKNEGHSLSYIYPIITYSLNPRGIIIFSINEGELNKLINGNTNENPASIFIMDQQGTVLSDANKSNLGRNMMSIPAIASIYSGTSREGHFFSKINGTQYFVVYWISELNNWYYCSLIPMNEINRKTNVISIFIGIAAIVFFISAAALSYPVAKKLNMPIKRMEFTIEEYELIQLFSIRVSSKDINKDDDENWSIKKFFIHPLFCCIILSPDRNYNRYKESNISHIDENAVINSALDIMRGHYLCRGLYLESDNIVIVINSSSFNIEFLEEALKSLQKQFLLNFGVSLSIGIGKISSFDEIAISYNTARRALYNRLISGLGCLEFYKEEPNATDNYFYPIDQENIIFNNLRLGLYDKISDAVNVFFLEIKNKKGLPIDNIILTFNQLMGCIIRYIIEKHIDIRKIFDTDINFYYKLFESEFIDNIQANFTQIFKRIIDFELCRNNESQKPINKILGFIHSNLYNTFDITALSDNLDLSYSQVRKIFKKETGENLLNYVYKQKIEAANKMLRETRLSAEEIAKATGFYNRQSFYHFYKKFEGITPNEFRQLLSGKSLPNPDT